MVIGWSAGKETESVKLCILRVSQILAEAKLDGWIFYNLNHLNIFSHFFSKLSHFSNLVCRLIGTSWWSFLNFALLIKLSLILLSYWVFSKTATPFPLSGCKITMLLSFFNFFQKTMFSKCWLGRFIFANV